MSPAPAPYLTVDWTAYRPERIQPLRHGLAGHPLLTLPSLMRLAARLPPGRVRCHATTATAASRIELTTVEHAHGLDAETALANIATSGSWIRLENIQTDPEYAALMHAVLDEVQTNIGGRDPGMYNRAFWVFIQSPGSTTPFHMDHEQNVLMQVSGAKRAWLWHPEQCVEDDATLEAFHAVNSRKELVYREAFNDDACKLELTPGNGVYMPSTCPHLVSNPDNVSVTVSMTYCTAQTRRTETLHRGNHALRRLGLAPARVGAHPRLDGLKYGAFRALLAARARARGEARDVPGWAKY